MIDQKVINDIENAVIEISSRQRNNFDLQCKLLNKICCSPQISYRELADYFEMDKRTVMRILLDYCGFNYPLGEQEKFVGLVNDSAKCLVRILDGDSETIENYKRLELKIPGKHKRMILLSFINQPQIKLSDKATTAIMRLNKDFATECIENIVDIIECNSNNKTFQELDYLNKALKRSQTLIKKLQDDFEARLEISKAEEQEMFFAKLNDISYGYILDILHSSQAGFEKLKAKGGTVPLEIRSIQTLVRRFSEFVRDFGITPMEMVGEMKEITDREAIEYDYDGSPFKDSNDRKIVKIISPGWKIKERNVVISYPRVREVEAGE